jgi:hypothetical protein
MIKAAIWAAMNSALLGLLWEVPSLRRKVGSAFAHAGLPRLPSDTDPSLVIPYFEPKGYLHLFYDNIDVGPAQQLDPVRVARQPYIKYNTTEPELLNIPYILIVLDPDASAGELFTIQSM